MSMYKETNSSNEKRPLIPVGEHKDLTTRKISKTVCEFFNYTVSFYAGKVVQVANYTNNGTVVAQHIRFADKKFIITGDKNKMMLGGMDKYKANEKIAVTIAEGAIDGLSVAQMMGTNFPIVWLPRGVKEAPALMKNEEVFNYLNSFKEIVICFDSDEPGKEYAVKLAALFGPNKVRIVSLPKHDVNDMLTSGLKEQFVKLWWNAPYYAPSNVYELSTFDIDTLFTKDDFGYSLPFPELSKLILGLQKGRIYTVCAGTGIGKTTFIKEIAYHLVTAHNLKVGCIFLEDTIKEALLSFYSINNSICINTIKQNIYDGSIDKESVKTYLNSIKDNVSGVNQFACDNIEAMVEKVQYLMTASECDVVFLDNITIVVTGVSGGDDRKLLDLLMTKLRSLCQRTGKTLISVVHLKRKDGTSYNDGGLVSVTDIRGSGAIEQISDVVIALERDQFSEEDANVSRIKVVKNRTGGTLRYTDTIRYDEFTGRLLVVDESELVESPIIESVQRSIEGLNKAGLETDRECPF